MTRDHETLLIRCFYTSIKLNMIIITAFAMTQAFKTVVERERERERKKLKSPKITRTKKIKTRSN